MEDSSVFWVLKEGVCIPRTLNRESRCSLSPGWSDRLFLGILENAEFIFPLETMWYMAVGGEVDGLRPW